MLLNPDKNDGKIYIKTNNSDINLNNYVKNGTLVFEISRVINFNSDIKKRKLMLNELDNDIKQLEIELSNNLSVPVRILYYDIVIPPVAKNNN